MLQRHSQRCGYQSLNKAPAFFAGSYRVRVNNSDTTTDVVAGEIRECATRSLTVAGYGSEYYYVLDKTGNQLNYNSLNKALSLFPSGYTVKFGQNTQPATVTAGQATTVKF